MVTAVEIGFVQDYKIRSNEIDIRKQANTPALIQMMQDASMHNAMKLKVSVWDLESENLSWVLMRKEIKFYAYPTFGQSVNVLTYPAGFDKVLAFRDFIVSNEKGEVIAEASSTWILMNTTTRRMVKIPVDKFNIPKPEDVVILDRPASKIDEVRNSSFSTDFHVHRYDLDWNNHVNNVFFIKSILEGVPSNYHNSYKVSRLLIHFKNESFENDVLTSQFEQISENSSKHNLIRKSDGKEIVRAEIDWEMVS